MFNNPLTETEINKLAKEFQEASQDTTRNEEIKLWGTLVNKR